MRFAVRHETRFEYDEPVVLGHLTVRLRPRTDGSIELIRYAIRADPEPLATVPIVDAAGNAATRMWFAGEAKTLIVESSFEAETVRANPFDWLVDPDVDRVPMRYGGEPEIDPFLGAVPDPAAAALAASVLSDAGGRAVTFLTGLAARIATDVRQTRREHGPPRPPAETLERGEGACRDTAMLFVAAARAAGMAARFVSGYTLPDPDAGSELHAWAEAYLPDAGWRGFDPASGLAVADAHVAVAAAAGADGAAPTEGTFSGSRSRLTSAVSVTTTPS